MIKFLIFLILFCKPADPNYRLKPLQNLEYTGFISRTFFQAVVEVPITREELGILEERLECKKQAFQKRDKLIIPILKKIALESSKNETLQDREKEWKEKSPEFISDSYRIISTETEKKKAKLGEVDVKGKTFLNKGEFTWFLDTMKIHKEIYDDKKCIILFRKIEKDLFSKVENTKLGIIGEDMTPIPSQTNSETGINPTGANQTGTQQNSSQTPLGTGIPSIGR